MSVLGGRGGRQDDWATQHARARARASERLDGPIDPTEEAWLDAHLAECTACAATAAEYAAQRLELRALRDRPPVPPRDLWARTAVAIEREARHRSLEPRRSQRSILAPYAVLAGVLVVAVVVGRLSSSQLPKTATASPSSSVPTQATTDQPSAAPTPVIVAPQEVAYLSVGLDGEYQWNNARVSEVCPDEADSCETTAPDDSRSIGPLPSPETVFGSEGGPLVVLGDTTNGSRVFVVAVPDKTAEPDESPTPSPTPVTNPPSATPSGDATPSPTPAIESPPPTESAPPSGPPTGTFEIARDVEVVDTTAAYAPDGSAFAFTARPADGSHGPDIYLWHVGDPQAQPITTDHRSVFGSWAGDTIVGSSIVTSEDGTTNAPQSFVYRADATTTILPRASAWRPVVDPTEGSAVYWTGSLEPTPDSNGWLTVTGRLVLGRWDVQADPSPAPSAEASPGEEEASLRETTIAEGPLTDWDARWDDTGTRLAVWIADSIDPTVGTLSLYVVDPADGHIDITASPILDEPALAGFSIADRRLAWASPPDSTNAASRVSILSWTDAGFGQVETAEGDFLLVR